MPLLLKSDPPLGGSHHILSPGHGQRMNQNVDITNLHSIPDMIRYSNIVRVVATRSRNLKSSVKSFENLGICYSIERAFSNN